MGCGVPIGIMGKVNLALILGHFLLVLVVNGLDRLDAIKVE